MKQPSTLEGNVLKEWRLWWDILNS